MEININNTLFIGKFLIYLPSIDSTNNYAKDYITKTSPIDGTVIFADEQFAGRGQIGNKWQTEPNKNLTFSIICQCRFLPATNQFGLSMAIAFGIAKALENILPTATVNIKWPNDILINNKKVAGILIENTIAGMFLNYSIIGIGLNVNQEEFSQELNATSLKLELKRENDRISVLQEILSSIEKYFLLLKEGKMEAIKTAYLNKLFQYKEVALYKKNEIEIEGTITDVEASGKLVMETKNGLERYSFKEIIFL